MAASGSTATDTPMLRQFREAKSAHPDFLLFFRMGDFYELFFDDAKVAAAALDIALTKRGQADGVDIPMAGVPVHSHESYLQRLIRAGHRVAICEQMEDPAQARKRGGKSIVRRDVVRIATPGTMTEDTVLDARANNYLAVVCDVAGQIGLAVVDITTGDLSAQALAPAGLASALARVAPAELLVAERLMTTADPTTLPEDWRRRATSHPTPRFDADAGAARVQALFGVGTLDGFGAFTRAETAALGALVDYLDLTQKGRMPRLAPPRRVADGAVLELDAATRRNLELTRTLAGDRAGSLLATIDRTVTGAGARRLFAWLAAPLTQPAAIDHRLDGVQRMAGDDGLRGDLRAALRTAPDLERALSRLGLGRGGPRDLAAIRDGLTAAQAIVGILARPSLTPPPAIMADAEADLGTHSALIDRLQAALAAELPLLARDGGFIAPGFDPGLDEQRALRDEGRRLIAALQARYAADTAIATLRVKHNNVLGYFIEVSPTQADKLAVAPHADTFVHRQTLASAVRFTTVELGDLERRLSEAGDRALALELALFAGLVAAVLDRADAIATCAGALAVLDVLAGLGDVAAGRAWSRPILTDDTGFTVVGGRHPVVEAALQASGAPPFVANDCDLSADRRVWLLTGPNMAGKSTFLRQNALIALLAQTGSFVPAARAEIGVVDRLFSRVGAADDLARGQSTFMVEMVETATILNQATERSLVILDEIGRGTATFDGLSIAWACVEHLHEVNRCRALFATHYHELTALSQRLPAMACHAMRVREWQGDIVFLHAVIAGTADRSYGVHVARLAGLPRSVVVRAEEVLDSLERGTEGRSLARMIDDLPLFTAAKAAEAAARPAAPSALDTALAAVDPDTLTPRDALELVYRLHALLTTQ